MGSSDPKVVLAVLRSSIGVGGWLAPIKAGRAFGIDASRDVGAVLYLRMGASRDFALAAAPFLANERLRRRALEIVAACDVGDIIAAAIAYRRGKIPGWGAGASIVASLSCLALSLQARTKVDG